MRTDAARRTCLVALMAVASAWSCAPQARPVQPQVTPPPGGSDLRLVEDVFAHVARTYVEGPDTSALALGAMKGLEQATLWGVSVSAAFGTGHVTVTYHAAGEAPVRVVVPLGRTIDEALRAVSSVYAIARQVAPGIPPDELERAMITHALRELDADLYLWQGRDAEAEAFLTRVLHVEEKAFGPERLALLQRLNQLASLLQARGKYSDAERLYIRALALAEKILGPDQPEVTQSLEDYATLLRRLGRTSEADGIEARARAIRAR